MLFADIDILDENFDHQPHQWVGVKDGRIVSVGAKAPEGAQAQEFGEVYDGAGKLLMPAFYNAHAHAPMTLLRGYAENLPLHAWLETMVWPFEAKMTAEDNYWATLLACAEMARYGVVSFSDMYFHTDERVRAVVESGCKANICESEMYFETKPFSEYVTFAKCEEYVAQYHGAADGRILIDYNIHAEYTSNPQTCKDIAAVTKEKGLRMHLHASETKSEHEECKERRGGLTPIAYFESLGVLDSPTTAAHCVWCEPADLDILAAHGVFVAANPASNMKLGSGYAPIPAMLERGVNVCLGTDGMASNNNHDMMQDLYLLASLYKGYQNDPTVVTPKQALSAATRMGALSQGRADCGLVRAGMRADLAVLDVSGPSWTPMTNPLVNAVFAGHGSDVCLTMCDGAVIYRDGVYPGIDLELVKAEAAARTRRIISEV
ncbi:MAG: amidohydrolase [Gordonibacter sp.]|uniref:amidohydrolase n=1 Tax=Gordonibacter sp. TaxID=1968902 RepID=UPI002FCAAE89